MRKKWPKFIFSYSAENIYNANKTGLYFRELPDHAYSIKYKSAKSHKISKGGITVLCYVRMAGEKEEILVVRKSKNSHYFRSI